MNPFTQLLKKELVCALGCTEPIAIALASAKARKVLGCYPSETIIRCSGNIIKNVKGVTVPNTDGLKGVEAATAIGLIAGDASKNLEVLSKVNDKDIEKAKEILKAKEIKVELKEGAENLDIEIWLKDHQGNDCLVEIQNKHSNFFRIMKNGQFLYQGKLVEDKQNQCLEELSIHSIVQYAKTVPFEEVQEMIDKQIALNQEISKEGLKGNWGVEVGKLLLNEGEGLRAKVKAYAAAGSDARMSGCPLPVVINAGSGNQGITCSLPVIIYAEEKNKSHELLVRSLLISNLVALHIKRYIGRLSAFCGVTSAGVAAGAALAFLESQDEQLVSDTISNSLMIVSGMVCDGAKPSCAAKIASAVDAGYTGFQMALRQKNFKVGEGLMKENVEQTIQAIGHLGKVGMKQTDLEILKMMLE
ncbi:serine dehydratase subunit alpha family protein [Bulleidia sp. zg-1006]|uniref:L-cysteine desulfidase family protein n=1 Tax=Bulleidia sp. zg-1006 TaxID=2806552 RepID=UPI00193A8129|nr:L-serine ammonia-lyase, iron-sulfur-dependent, subunit alpha [Bulleidia sp. zg-1006]QRG87280.1 serine dehydratase subunit alpha family protein [Bulleidia sp. zg-1006]